jgi:hypothetical protein
MTAPGTNADRRCSGGMSWLLIPFAIYALVFIMTASFVIGRRHAACG